MAYTALSVQTPTKDGVTLTFTQFDDTNGMKVPNDGKTILLIKNANGLDTVNLTVNTPGDVDGNAIADVTGNGVADGAIGSMGPFKPDVYNQNSTADKGHVLFDAGSGTFGAGVTVAAVGI